MLRRSHGMGLSLPPIVKMLRLDKVITPVLQPGAITDCVFATFVTASAQRPSIIVRLSALPSEPS